MGSIPDISAISTPEVELPTLSLDSGQLSSVSVMDHVATIHLDPLHSHLYSVDTTQSDPVMELTSLQPMSTGMDINFKSIKKPYLKILEQPKSNTLRFRYQCEGRGAGALQGERSSTEPGSDTARARPPLISMQSDSASRPSWRAPPT